MVTPAARNKRGDRNKRAKPVIRYLSLFRPTRYRAHR
jgi:hypothetical protein